MLRSLKEFGGLLFKGALIVMALVSSLELFGVISLPSEVWPLLVLATIGLSFWAFHKIRIERDNIRGQLQATGETPAVILPTPVLYINIIDYQFGTPATSGYPAGKHDTLWLRLYINFNAPMPILVESLKIELIGKRISAFEWKSGLVTGDYAQYFYFKIPVSISSGEHTVQVVALSGREERGSGEFPVTFPAR